MCGSYIAPDGDNRYIMKFSFETMFDGSFVWLEIFSLIVFIAVVVIAVINIFKKNTILTSILLGGSVFSSLLYVFNKSSCTLGTSYFTVARGLCFGNASYESTLVVQDIIFIYSYILISVLLTTVLVLTFLGNKNKSNEKEA